MHCIYTAHNIVEDMLDRTYNKGVLKVEIVFYKFEDGTSPVKDFVYRRYKSDYEWRNSND